MVFAKLKEDLHPFERVGLTVLACLVATGLALRWLDRRWRIEDWLERPPEPDDARRPPPRRRGPGARPWARSPWRVW